MSSLREKCPNAEFFWSVFSRIQSKYGKIQTRKTTYLNTSHAVHVAAFITQSSESRLYDSKTLLDLALCIKHFTICNNVLPCSISQNQ